jgi:hypothetical protein
MDIPEEMDGALWNAKVSRFDVKRLAEQLSELDVPYFFITIGQRTGYYCSPNLAYERLFGPSGGTLTDRDLVADLSAELVPRGISMCVYLPAVGRLDPAEKQAMWREVISEWSVRWGKAISAWWIDGNFGADTATFREYTRAFRSGNPEALVSYNTGPLGMGPDPKEPATEHEDYLAGEVNWHLPVSGARLWDGKKFYLGPDLNGDQLHFLTFLGEFWGYGKPRFPIELVIGWTRHTNNHGGTISWDLPLGDDGTISGPFMNQLRQLRDAVPVH